MNQQRRTPIVVLLLVVLLGGVFAPMGFAVWTVTSASAAQRAVPCDNGYTPTNTGPWRVPLETAYTATSEYGWRFHPIYHEMRLHTGIDLVLTAGPGSVVAASAGTVFHAGEMGGYGNAVIVDHGGGISTLYGHLSRIAAAVQVGQPVYVGQLLGVEGSTGASTGLHLHFEVRQGGQPIDPRPWFRANYAIELDGSAAGHSQPPADGDPPPGGGEEGGIGFPLPLPGEPRQNSLTNPPLTVPVDVQTLYQAAAVKYAIPWTLLAGIGMEETGHGRNTATSTAGAQGLMQFMPSTWTTMGVDGDGDGTADILNPADSIFSAANYLTKSGVRNGPQGVTNALYTYNHATWYVNDVLFYAHAYGGGIMAGDPSACVNGPGGDGNPDLPDIEDARIRTVLTWAASHDGDAYRMGATGPNAWDCSSYVRAAYGQISISLPRTAQSQRDWLAQGNGKRVQPGAEKPGDLVFYDSYLGPNAIGHVALVWDPATTRTIEAHSSSRGVGYFTYGDEMTSKNIFEIWRVGNIA